MGSPVYRPDGYAVPISPNKGETAVHGCHCPGDMALRICEVLVRLWVGVCVLLALSLSYKLQLVWQSLCTLQIGEEIKGCLDFLKFVYNKFGFTFKLYLSTRPDKYMGKLELWNDAEKVSLPRAW